MAPKPFKPPGPSTAVSSTLFSPSIAVKKNSPLDRSKDSPVISNQKKKGISNRIFSGSSSSTITSTGGRKKVSNVSTKNKRRKIVDKSDRRASSTSAIKLPSLSPSSNDEAESSEKIRGLIDSEAEEENLLDQEDEFMKDLEIDEIMDDNESESENDDDPFGSDTNLSRRSRNNDSRRLSRKNREDDNDDLILAEIDIDNDDDDDDEQDEDEDDASATINSKDQDIFIPRDLVSVLLHEMFKSTDNTQEREEERRDRKGGIKRGQIRMTKQAVDAVGKYLDTFVKEAVARATCEGLERGGNGVLEVEDLERLAPQLILDF